MLGNVSQLDLYAAFRTAKFIDQQHISHLSIKWPLARRDLIENIGIYVQFSLRQEATETPNGDTLDTKWLLEVLQMRQSL